MTDRTDTPTDHPLLWLGVLDPAPVRDDVVAASHRLADAAKVGSWSTVFDLLDDPDLAPLYAQALVGSVSMTAQWWLDTREPKKEVVAAHLVNLVWNGLTHLEADPHLADG